MNRRHLTFTPATAGPLLTFPESINFAPALAHVVPTLPDTLTMLVQAGYTESFLPHGNLLAGQRSGILLAAAEFVVDNHYHFDGPADSAATVVYAISSLQFNLKGTLVHSAASELDYSLMQAMQAQTG
jgi:hypothetical protein